MSHGRGGGIPTDGLQTVSEREVSVAQIIQVTLAHTQLRSEMQVVSRGDWQWGKLVLCWWWWENMTVLVVEEFSTNDGNAGSDSVGGQLT